MRMPVKRRRVWRRPGTPGHLLLRLLLALFCLFYILTFIGAALNVQPILPMDWLVSLLLYLVGILLIMVAALVYSVRRAISASVVVCVLAYMAEALSVNTGFPFGRYSYTAFLFPTLLGGVPLPVLFAWILVIFGVYSWFRSRRTGLRLSLIDVLVAGLVVMLLDGALEPMAARIIGYRHWVDDASFFYHIPLSSFAGWFVLGALLVWLIDRQFAPAPRPRRDPPRMAFWLPRLLFACSLFLFGVVDLTHGYYGGTVCALLLVFPLTLYARRR